MADTTTAPNNKALAFKGKPEREAAGSEKTDGQAAPIKPAKGARKKARAAVKRGMISPKAAAKHLKDY